MMELQLKEESVLIFETDTHGSITFANDDFLHYCGYSWKELRGTSIYALCRPDAPESGCTNLFGIAPSNRIHGGMIRFMNKRGEFYRTYATVRAVVSDSHETRYLSQCCKPTPGAIRNQIMRQFQ